MSETPKVPKVLDAVADKVLGYRPKEAKKKLRKKARKAKRDNPRRENGGRNGPTNSQV